jgi:hypothetical protein
VRELKAGRDLPDENDGALPELMLTNPANSVFRIP